MTRVGAPSRKSASLPRYTARGYLATSKNCGPFAQSSSLSMPKSMLARPTLTFTVPVPAARSKVTSPLLWSNLPRQYEMPMWSAVKLG